jgi:predicted PurR-regulated permease PerM
LHFVQEHLGQLGKVRTQIAELAAGGEAEEQPVTVRVKEPELTSSAVVLSTTGNMVGMWLVVVVLSYFLLTAGDSLINNVLTILPTFREKRLTVELIKEIERGISSYLVTITLINLGLGCLVGVVLWMLGVPNPAVWGLMTTVFNYVPFVGQAIAGLVIGIVALLSFDSVGYALLVPVIFYAIAAVEGNVVTPMLLGRNMSLNPILVLTFLVCWGWMWGIAGAALAVPILAMLKIGCDHFESTRPVGTLLGG